METVRGMYEHLIWANKRMLHHLEYLGVEEINLFSHVLFAEKVWFTRLKGNSSSHLPIWKNVTVEDCKELLKQNEAEINAFFTSLTNSGLQKKVVYQNSQGDEFQESVRDILTQVALHGQYHRGQMNQKLRLNGLEPVNVDFIMFSREVK